jgi:hypothetical protein
MSSEATTETPNPTDDQVPEIEPRPPEPPGVDDGVDIYRWPPDPDPSRSRLPGDFINRLPGMFGDEDGGQKP